MAAGAVWVCCRAEGWGGRGQASELTDFKGRYQNNTLVKCWFASWSRDLRRPDAPDMDVWNVLVFRCIFGEQVQTSSKFKHISVILSLIAPYELKN